MNRFALLLILGSCVVLLAAAGIAAAEDHGDRVCIYNHENFHGHEQCYRPGDEVSDLKHADIESIRVFGNVRAMVFEERDFRGSVVEFNSNIRDLKHVNLTGAKELDHVGSLRVISDVAFNSGKYYEPPDYAFVRSKPYPGTASIDEGVCVYERPRFEGRFQCWRSGTDVSDPQRRKLGRPDLAPFACSAMAVSSASNTRTFRDNVYISIMMRPI